MKIIIDNSGAKAEIEIPEDGVIEEYMDAFISSLILETFSTTSIYDGLKYGIYKLTNKSIE